MERVKLVSGNSEKHRFKYIIIMNFSYRSSNSLVMRSLYLRIIRKNLFYGSSLFSVREYRFIIYAHIVIILFEQLINRRRVVVLQGIYFVCM